MNDHRERIKIGNSAGHHFFGDADLQVSYHCSRGQETGYYFKRKRLVDRAAFDYDPRLGWEVDRWFEWHEEQGR